MNAETYELPEILHTKKVDYHIEYSKFIADESLAMVLFEGGVPYTKLGTYLETIAIGRKQIALSASIENHIHLALIQQGMFNDYPIEVRQGFSKFLLYTMTDKFYNKLIEEGKL